MTKYYSKIAAIGILLILLYMAWMVLARPYIELWDERIRTAQLLHKKQASLSSLIDNRSTLEQQFRAISNNRGLREVFLDQKSGALADVKLQRILKHIITNSGGRILQSQIKQLKPSANKNPASRHIEEKSVTVKILMQGSIQTIYKVLATLENNRPLIVVSDLEISLQQSRYQTAVPSDNANYRAMYDATAYIF